ncbi:MAG: CopD family protein [Bacteroidia bacterium]
MWYTGLIFLHIVFACIWVGGHIVLCFGYLPKALKNKDVSVIQNFESVYEKIGIPALAGQIITGVIMFLLRVQDFSNLLNWGDFYGRHFLLKMILLLITLALALHARFRIIPNLNENNLPLLAVHIILVTIIGILFVLIGLSIRVGLFF